ncbi:MAG: choice-of-anchor tandem repeat GloVer-containing protein [Ferruginibacter sp.]
MKIYTSFIRKRSISFAAWNANIIFLISIGLSISNAGKGQVIYGTTSHGGHGGGTITKYDVSSNTLTDVFVYEVPGTSPGELVEASNGKFYGTTSAGGSNNAGTIYSLEAVTYRYTSLKNLDSGASPNGGLVEGADKKLYGTTSSGTIFSFDPALSDFTTLKTFTYTDGAEPFGKLVQIPDGRLCGMTIAGGVNNGGVLMIRHLRYTRS